MFNDNVTLHTYTKNNHKLLTALNLAYSPLKTKRVRIWYGDVRTGEAWPEENDIMGYISLSSGPKPIPILLYRRSSIGGGGLLDHCIVRMDFTDGRTIYKHEAFHTNLESKDKEVFHKGKNFAKFNSAEEAHAFIDFMEGHRYSKSNFKSKR